MTFPIVKGFDFDPFSVAKGTILVLGIRSQGYYCENPDCTPSQNFSPQDNSVGSGVVWVTGLFSLCVIEVPIKYYISNNK